MTQRKRYFFFLALPITMAVAHACSNPVAGGDSESHFLADCVATCANGLSCVCGVCTRACIAASDCTTVNARAECTTALEPACSAAGRTCDVACLSDDTCTTFGHGYSCVGGRCRSVAGARDASAVALHDGSPVSAGGSSGGDTNLPVVHDGSPTSSGGSGGCGHLTYPAPPVPGGTAGGHIEIVAVQSSVDFGDSPTNLNQSPTRFLSVGLDLDNRCTLSSDLTNQECHIPAYANGVVDGAEGQDNAFGQVMQLTRNIMGDSQFSSSIYSAQLRRGVTNLIFHVQDYNGEANDDQVSVSLLVSAPFDSPPKTSGTLPNWDANDVWPIASDSLSGGSTPRFVDKNAYVVAGKIVASLPEADLRLILGVSALARVDLDLPLRGTYVVCDVVSTAAGSWGYALKNCTLAGRLLADDLIHELSHFPDPGRAAGQPLCSDSAQYSIFKRNLCGLVDLSNNGPTKPPSDCNALSLGLSFDTEPAFIGDAITVNPVGELCPSGSQPSTDSCAGGDAGP